MKNRSSSSINKRKRNRRKRQRKRQNELTNDPVSIITERQPEMNNHTRHLINCMFGNNPHSIDEIVNFYIENQDTVDIHVQNELPFRWMCRNGYIEHAKWLYYFCLVNDNAIDIRESNDSAFVSLCQQGYLEAAQWLFEESGHTINVNMRNGEAFRQACKSHSLEMVMWLLKTSIETGNTIDVHAYNDSAWRMAQYCFDEAMTDCLLQLFKEMDSLEEEE